MVFSSLTFLLLFLPALLALYFICPKLKWRNAILLFFSLVFYAWGEPKWIVCMVGATLVNYLAALWMQKAKQQRWRRVALLAGVVVSLGALVYFKYTNFFLSNLAALFGTAWTLPAVTLPIGISFYTFQILTYTVDVYRGKAAVQRNPFKLLLYVSCFPQLIAGPIVQYTDIAAQLDARTTSLTDFGDGMGRFAVGLGKKVLLANLCGKMLEALLGGGAASTAGAWLSAILYMLQIYFDFSAYSDMAIGLGRVLGFRYKENFNYPYISDSVSGFWRRWHISLGSFFREYVYIPLGGNRGGVAKTVRNLLIVWTLTGLWHGASWNFLLWGVYYGVWIILERFVLQNVLTRIPKAIRILGTLLVVLFGWVLFYYTDLNAAFAHMGRMFGVGADGLWNAALTETLRSYTVFPIVAAVCALPIVPALKRFFFDHDTRRAWVGTALQWCGQTAVLLLSVLALVGQSYNPFIYFRF